MRGDTKRFNRMAKGRCKDKYRAMANLCELSENQYNILVMKFCNGRVGMTRVEIAEKLGLSETSVDREYRNAKDKIDAILKEYKQPDFEGRFFFRLDEILNKKDWSKYTKRKYIEEDDVSDKEIYNILYSLDNKKMEGNMNDLAEYLGFKKKEEKSPTLSS